MPRPYSGVAARMEYPIVRQSWFFGPYELEFASGAFDKWLASDDYGGWGRCIFAFDHEMRSLELLSATNNGTFSMSTVADFLIFEGTVPTAGDTPGPTAAQSDFALLYDQELNAPIRLYARDGAGNEAEADFDHRVFPRRFRRSRIPVSDRFLARVVPDVTARSEAFASIPLPPGAGLLEQYLALNGPLRRLNAERIRELAADTAGERLWSEPFRQLANSQVESGFGDHRTYVYEGREVDQQVHLGFDLSATANVPIVAANAGRVVWADYLGIYGNCVIVDHGLGLQSLYAHLSSIGVRTGDAVAAGAELGRSGTTGLAGGDHLHFEMLLDGEPITPVEWWDPHWIEDRVNRKLRAAS